jgi:hypothetical protein
LQELLEKKFQIKKWWITVFWCLQLYAQGSLIYALVENKIFTIFSLILYYGYMPTMETYPQKASFRLLILDTKKS